MNRILLTAVAAVAVSMVPTPRSTVAGSATVTAPQQRTEVDRSVALQAQSKADTTEQHGQDEPAEAAGGGGDRQ